MSSDDERDEKELDLSSPEVVTKYKTAAEIVNSNALFLLLFYPFPIRITFLFPIFSSLVFSVFIICFAFCVGIAEALQVVLAECKPKAKIVDICEKGDAFIKE